jgi:hypothetical protein
LPQRGYIGLFTDGDRSSWCASGTPMYPVEMWFLCLPSYLGQICVEFGILYPENAVRSITTQNTALLTVSMPGFQCDGDICYGGLCYVACQWDWHWVLHQTIYVMDAMPSYIEIIDYPYSGTLQFANCEPGYPTEPCTVLTKLHLNYAPDAPECTATGVESASWGAIKTLLR